MFSTMALVRRLAEQEMISVALMKWAIGGLVALVLILIAWLKSALAENKALAQQFIQDLKERNRTVTRNTPPPMPKQVP